MEESNILHMCSIIYTYLCLALDLNFEMKINPNKAT